jgi:hypothetical protein
MKRIAVYCGSSIGANDVYKKQAILLGELLARKQITLVYGGASVGIMGTVADAVLTNGGQAIGVIPSLLEKREIAHKHLTELIHVETMHERKAKMMELSDGFIALPGGPGTLEEFFEVFTWNQIGLLQKPCGILNINGYYDKLIELFDHMINEQFVQERARNVFFVDGNHENLLQKMYAYVPPAVKSYHS